MPLKEKLTFKPFRPVAKLHGNCFALGTGKSLSEALIFGSTNPQHDKRLFIDLPILYMKTTSSEHKLSLFLFWRSEQFMYTTCSVVVNQWTIFCHIVDWLMQEWVLLKKIYQYLCQNNLCHNMFWACSEFEIFMYWACNSMNNLLSCCGLVDARKKFTCNNITVLNSQIECYSKNVYCWNPKKTLIK